MGLLAIAMLDPVGPLVARRLMSSMLLLGLNNMIGKLFSGDAPPLAWCLAAGALHLKVRSQNIRGKAQDNVGS